MFRDILESLIQRYGQTNPKIIPLYRQLFEAILNGKNPREYIIPILKQITSIGNTNNESPEEKDLKNWIIQLTINIQRNPDIAPRIVRIIYRTLQMDGSPNDNKGAVKQLFANLPNFLNPLLENLLGSGGITSTVNGIFNGLPGLFGNNKPSSTGSVTSSSSSWVSCDNGNTWQPAGSSNCNSSPANGGQSIQGGSITSSSKRQVSYDNGKTWKDVGSSRSPANGGQSNQGGSISSSRQVSYDNGETWQNVGSSTGASGNGAQQFSTNGGTISSGNNGNSGENSKSDGNGGLLSGLLGGGNKKSGGLLGLF